MTDFPEVELVKKLPAERTGFSRANVEDFPPLYKGESQESTGLRVAAFQKVCDGLRGHFDGMQPEGNRSTFEQVEAFARANHISGEGEGAGQVPVGILYAGGVNPSDHTRTFTALREYLSRRNFYVALVNGRDLTPQDGHRNAFRKILKAFSGLETDADDFRGVMDWYEEVTNPKGASRDKERVGKSPRRSSKRKMPSGDADGTPRRVTRALSKNVRAKRDDAPKDEAAEGVVQESPPPGCMDNPLVVVIDDGESADPKRFTDLVQLLSDARPRMKVTLLVGTSTNAETLQRFILVDAPYRVCCRRFALTPSRRCLEQAFRQVLIAVDGPFVVLGKDLSDALTDQHLYHDSTIEGFKQGLLLACTHHFARAPLSGLLSVLASTLGGGNANWEDIPDDLLKFARQQLNVCKGESLPSLLAGCIQRVTAWKLGLIWIHEIAESLGKMTRASGCTWRDLYCAAVGDGFGESAGFALIKGLSARNGLQRLGREELLCLLTNLESVTMECEKLSRQMDPYVQQLQGLRKDIEAATDDPPEEEEAASRERVEQQPVSVAPQQERQKKTQRRKGVKARRALLMQSFASTAPAAPSAAPQTCHTKIATKIAEFLRKTIQDFCGSPPERFRGSGVFCFGGGDAVRNHLLGAPRLSLERALTHPQKYMPNALVEEDLSVAYQTYKATLGDRLNLADWFLAFSMHFNLDIQGDREQGCEQKSPEKKSENGEKSKKEGFSDRKRKMLARFEKALRELQFLGFVKKNGEHVRCLIFND